MLPVPGAAAEAEGAGRLEHGGRAAGGGAVGALPGRLAGRAGHPGAAGIGCESVHADGGGSLRAADENHPVSGRSDRGAPGSSGAGLPGLHPGVRPAAA
ncbi:hypothetical protein SDC9_196627 [bioreactor metagenome]|uniref:Uncharacterized protein n=1 Tax=bioreactor metagenome TaxID=1076179 RepID=A0A645IL20_9ZZZZ